MLRTFLVPIAATLLLLPAATHAQEAGNQPIAPGEYRDRSSFESFHALRLNADGTYEWALAAGAMERHSAGTWEDQGGVVTLTTVPRPVAPEIRRLPDDTSPDAPFLQISWPNGRAAELIDLILYCGDGKQIRHYTQEEGWDLVPGECDAPERLVLEQSVGGIDPAYFELEGTRRGLRFTIVPNDMGILDLTGTQIIPTETGIAMWLEENFAEMERVDTD